MIWGPGICGRRVLSESSLAKWQRQLKASFLLRLPPKCVEDGPSVLSPAGTAENIPDGGLGVVCMAGHQTPWLDRS